LEDAVDCFQNNVLAQSLKSRRLFQEAEKWIVEVDDGWLFSFENVCETLDLNPAYVRQGLLRWMLLLLGAESRRPTRKKRETNESSTPKRRRFRRQISWRQPAAELHKTSKKFKED
jgi:hypothetical protein